MADEPVMAAATNFATAMAKFAASAMIKTLLLSAFILGLTNCPGSTIRGSAGDGTAPLRWWVWLLDAPSAPHWVRGLCRNQRSRTSERLIVDIAPLPCKL
ncbi:hypothetical protein [Tsuneonella deserti]|uniref:hypothetical protein n=1 Tax=Tsuneonella deserti TaxID=2035528 RepID=UPI001666CB19|nr:hypothetical protein [Tsuneonella deserti]